MRTWSARRLALVLLAGASALVGAWAAFFPDSFYNDFVFGRGWVRLDGPYNEHLIRDVGALNLALALVVSVAAVRVERSLVRLAAGTVLVFAVPHLVYHAGAMNPFGPGDVVAQMSLLILQVVVPVWLLVSPGGDSGRSATSLNWPASASPARKGNRGLSGVILRADAAFLGLAGLIQGVLETLGHAGIGPQADTFRDQPFTIGFVEAHALAVVIAVVLLWGSRHPQPAPWHLLAATVHLILGAANLAFWESFETFGMVPAGVMATGAHLLFLVGQLLAYRRATISSPPSPAHSTDAPRRPEAKETLTTGDKS